LLPTNKSGTPPPPCPYRRSSCAGRASITSRGFDVALPRDSLIVITGLSGSGKSSLAFDTIYAEGQRRYVESLSAYARQFLEMMQKPDVEHIDGLSPAISIEQKTTSRNPRSTVATVTEIYDYMRLLWARIGVPYSPATGLPIEAQTVSTMVDRVMALPEGTRLYLLAPVVRGRKGEYRRELAEWQKAGYTRVRIDGEMMAIEDAPALDKKFKHDIEVVVDRLAVRAKTSEQDGIETRLADSFEQALKLAEGLAYVDLADGTVPGRDEEDSGGAMKGAGLPPNRIVFSEKFACPVSGFTLEAIEPRLFSFNAPQGACPACDGLGEKLLFDPQLVVPNEHLSLKQGAVVPWAKSNPPSPYYMQVLSSLAAEYGFDLATPWDQLAPEHRDVILFGTKGKAVPLTFKDGRKSYNRAQELRRRDRQPQPPPAPDRERVDARGAGQVPGRAAVRDLPRRAAQARGAERQGRGRRHRRTDPDERQRRQGVVRRARGQAQAAAPADRPRDPERDQRAAGLPRQRRARLPQPRPHQRYSVRRRKPAHPPRQPDRVGLSGVLYVLDEPSIGLHQRTTTGCSRRSNASATSATR
jgi:excinuclease ABC subunit A